MTRTVMNAQLITAQSKHHDDPSWSDLVPRFVAMLLLGTARSSRRFSPAALLRSASPNPSRQLIVGPDAALVPLALGH